jgi:hypothetical protein
MSQPVIDIGILTIREDEFRAVLKVFPDEHGIYKGRHREYTLRTTDAGQPGRLRRAPDALEAARADNLAKPCLAGTAFFRDRRGPGDDEPARLPFRSAGR